MELELGFKLLLRSLRDSVLQVVESRQLQWINKNLIVSNCPMDLHVWRVSGAEIEKQKRPLACEIQVQSNSIKCIKKR